MLRRPVRRPMPSPVRGSSSAHKQSQAAEIEGQVQRIATLTLRLRWRTATSQLFHAPKLGQTRNTHLSSSRQQGATIVEDVSPKSPRGLDMQWRTYPSSTQMNFQSRPPITVAQQRGRQLDEVVKKTEEHAETMADVHGRCGSPPRRPRHHSSTTARSSARMRELAFRTRVDPDPVPTRRDARAHAQRPVGRGARPWKASGRSVGAPSLAGSPGVS